MHSSSDSIPRRTRRLAQHVLLAPRATASLVAPRLPEPGPLRWFWLDGIAASLHDAMVVTFIPLMALAMGATAAEIGWMSSLGALAGTAVLIPGAHLAERLGKPHRLVVWSSIVARLAILAIALWPFSGRAGLMGVVAFATLRTAFGQLLAPAWTAVAADIVPADRRGRYFGSRNMAIALAAIAGLAIAGRLIESVGGLAGYRVDFAVAAFVGFLSSYFYARITPPPGRTNIRGRGIPLLRDLRQRRAFVRLMVHGTVWNLGLFIAVPFFNVYLVDTLGASVFQVGLLAIVATVASLPGQQLWGGVSDRVGARRTLVRCALLIPALPWAWIFVSAPWHVALLNVAGGFIWAGYNIAAFNLLLETTPDDARPRYVALYTTLVGLAATVGPLVGGWLAGALGFRAVFLASGAVRMVAVLLYLAMGHDDSDPPPGSEGH